jgi:hypothetical protein
VVELVRAREEWLERAKSPAASSGIEQDGRRRRQGAAGSAAGSLEERGREGGWRVLEATE